ncbi:rho GTPase-activating protein 5-like isoform X2 [Actinia tenebrosa]|uniref:Rho GTPase-activating protein 5-like isoform X2 n=1 Tax=Actinia tenebrosa TaxID=6105 RepID=A0A6P8I459_ACTTE|nr:rho GTPase-activating protein 5-like isoform X2 [Actinia tenebrosa]
MSKKANEARTYNISVVGLSGLDKDQCLYGVGKSCLCNRFVRPLADDFITDHTSVFSTSDFGGRVINNDSFLYWGTTTKVAEDGTEYRFNVIEQTELIDDASLMPLARGVPYPKRATTTKLSSPEKLMYISREQVALQNDYPQVLFPTGKLTVDGFLVVYDVEATNAKRLEEAQERFLSTLLSLVQKTKRPFVIVANKCDDTQLSLLQEVYRFIQSKKINSPIVECSAIEDVNVDLGFVVLAQLIDKGKVRSKLIPYSEAHKTHQEMMEKILQEYQALINRTVSDFKCLWKDVKKEIEGKTEYQNYKDHYGSESCKKLFTKHIRKLRREFEERKLMEYLLKLPHALDDLVPTMSSLELCQYNWDICQKLIRNHKDLSKWMIVLDENTVWNESEHLFSVDSRIPFDVLSLPEAKQAFQIHIDKLKEAEKGVRMRNEFRKLLELTPQIRPGSEWAEIEGILQNEESFKYLKDTDRREIFNSYLSDIAENAKADFQELLFESASCFTKLEPNATTPSEDDMKAIYASLCLDDRYRRLDKLENARKIRILNHIALLNSSSRCLCGPEKCSDRLMQEIVATTAHGPEYSGSDETLDSEDSQLSIVVLGSDGLADALSKEIQAQCSYGGEGLEYVLDGRLYELDLRVVDGDVDIPEYAITNADNTPHGYFCVYSTLYSLEYVQDVLESMYCKPGYNSVDETNMLNLSASITIFLAKSPDNEDVLPSLRQKGQDLAKRFGASFIDIPLARFSRDKMIHETQVVDAMRILVEDIKQQARTLNSTDDIRDSESDLRIMLCAMCGDSYPVELIFGPLLHHQACWRSPTQPDTIILETYVGFVKRRVQIKLTSYHRAYTLNDQMFHGYILVYSAKRKASLATLSAFSSSIPHVPIQVLAVTGRASGASVVFHSNDVPVSLLAEGINLASKLYAKFQTTSTRVQHQGGLFAAFFNRVWEKKDDSEMAYAEFMKEQRARQEHRLQLKKRSVHDPLPAPPNARRRTASEHLPASPRAHHRLSASNLDDTSPYAEFSPEQKALIAAKSSSGEHLVPMTSTPNTALTNHMTNEEKPETPLNPERRPRGDDIYAVPDKTRKKSFRKSKDASAFNESETNLIENSLYANPNLVSNTGAGYDEIPPALPDRMYNYDEDYPPDDSGVDTLRSILNGYSTINSEAINNVNRAENRKSTGSSRVYEEIPHANPPASPKDPYQYNVRTKIQMFDEKTKHDNTKQDVWVKRTKPTDHRNSVPDLYSKVKKAPLAQQEDDEEPGYARVKDDCFELHAPVYATVKDKPQENMMAFNSGTLRSAHSAEELGSATLDKRYRNKKTVESFNFTRNKRGEQRRMLDSVNSDGGTGDEDSMSRKHDRDRKKKFVLRDYERREKRKALLERKRDSTRKTENTETVTSNVSVEIVDKNNERTKSKMPKESKKNRPSKGKPFVGDSNEESSDTSSLENKKKKNTSKISNASTTTWFSTGSKGDSLEVPTRQDMNESKENSMSKKKLNRLEKEKMKEERRREEKIRKQQKKQKKKKNAKFKRREEMPSSYFGLSLEAICEQGKITPLFVEKAIEYIESEGRIQLEGIYRKNGNALDVRLLMEKFEENHNVDLSTLNISVHSVTGAIKSFFKRLPEPLIPNNLQESILEATVIMDANERLAVLKDLINEMPPLNLALLKQFTFHLNRVTEYSHVNLMESRNLSTVIFPTLLRIEFESFKTMARQMNFGLFIQTCIEKCEYFFGEDPEGQEVQ